MQKSLYAEYVVRNFPNLVLSIAETLNGRSMTSQIPFLFRDELNTMFSPDGRWETVSGKYHNVAADIIAIGSPTPLKGRDKMNSYTGELPKFGTMRSLNEKEMLDIKNMIAINRPEAEVVKRIFKDVPFVINAVDEGIEDVFLSMLSTGVGIRKNNVGEAVKFDMHYTDYTDNHKGVAAVWNASNIASGTAKPLNDIEDILNTAESDGNSVIKCFADDTALRAMYNSEQVRAMFGFQQNFVGGAANIPTLSYQQLVDLFDKEWNIELIRVRRTTLTEVNGVQAKHKAWANGRMVFTCDPQCGDLVYTTTAEESRYVTGDLDAAADRVFGDNGVAYQKANEYTLVSQFSEQEPLMEYTKSQAMVVPVLSNVNRIYSLDTQTAQL